MKFDMKDIFIGIMLIFVDCIKFLEFVYFWFNLLNIFNCVYE